MLIIAYMLFIFGVVGIILVMLSFKKETFKFDETLEKLFYDLTNAGKFATILFLTVYCVGLGGLIILEYWIDLSWVKIGI